MDNIKERFISEQDLTSAWIMAVYILMNQPKNEAFNLIVRMKDPTVEIPRYREMIEDYLSKHARKWQQDQIEMVAQTIFPRGLLYSTCPDPRNSGQREKFYARYMKNKSIIRSFNSGGTYFQRMIWWPSWNTPKEKRINQLETVIQKIKGGKASRVVYELAVDNPPISGSMV